MASKSEMYPLLVAMDEDRKDVVRLFVENAKEKNPKNETGETLLHYTATKGWADVHTMIMDNVEEKNPCTTKKYKDQVISFTPLHLAAGEGHLDTCCVILERVEDKNPKNSYGNTPP